MHEVTQLLGQKALVMEQLREEKEKARLAAQELEKNVAEEENRDNDFEF